MFLMGIAGGIGAVKYLPALGQRTTPTRIVAAKPIERTEPAPATQFTAVETKVPEPDPTTDHAAYQELQTLRDEMSGLNSAQHAAADDRAAPVPDDPTIQSPVQPAAPAAPTGSTGEKTLAYWNGMNAIMEHEAALRAAPPKIAADNALSFVSGETAAYQYAADAIRKLNRAGVDADVISLRAKSWRGTTKAPPTARPPNRYCNRPTSPPAKANPAKIGNRPKNNIANNACKSTARASNCAIH